MIDTSAKGGAEEEKKEETKVEPQVTSAPRPTKFRCTHASNVKCPNCMNEEEGLIQDRKHEPFDGFIAAARKKCAKTHASN